METLNQLAKRYHLKKDKGFFLLSTHQHKAEKALSQGYMQGMLQLQPCYKITEKSQSILTKYGFKNVKNSTCPYAGICKKICLADCGHNSKCLNKYALPCRIRKTKLLLEHVDTFFLFLERDLELLSKKARENNLLPVARLNCLSDLDWPHFIFEHFPEIQFLDYTKDFQKALCAAESNSWPKNYHITFSYNELYSLPNTLAAFNVTKRVNVAVVLKLPKTAAMPSELAGAKVVDGDEHDLRFLDNSGSVVGLRFKCPKRLNGFIPPKELDRLVLDVSES